MSYSDYIPYLIVASSIYILVIAYFDAKQPRKGLTVTYLALILKVALVVICSIFAYHCDVLNNTCSLLQEELSNKRKMVAEELARQEHGYILHMRKQKLLGASFTLKLDLKEN